MPQSWKNICGQFPHGHVQASNSKRAKPMPSFGSWPKAKAVSGLPTFIMILGFPWSMGMDDLQKLWKMSEGLIWVDDSALAVSKMLSDLSCCPILLSEAAKVDPLSDTELPKKKRSKARELVKQKDPKASSELILSHSPGAFCCKTLETHFWQFTQVLDVPPQLRKKRQTSQAKFAHGTFHQDIQPYRDHTLKNVNISSHGGCSKLSFPETALPPRTRDSFAPFRLLHV